MPSMSVVDRLANIWDASLHRILRLVSVEAASAVGSFVVRANVRLHRRDIIAGARRNLAIHRPELTEPEIRAFIWRFIDNVGRFMGEFSVLSRMQEERRIELIGAEALKAVDGVEPVVVIGLHTGNWEVFGHPLRDAGLKLATFYETPPRPAQERIVVETRREAGWQLLDPSPRGMREAMSLLKQKRIIVIFGDEARDGRLNLVEHLGRALPCPHPHAHRRVNKANAACSGGGGGKRASLFIIQNKSISIKNKRE